MGTQRPSVFLGPSDLASGEVELSANVDHPRVHVNLGPMQAEDYAWAHRRLSDARRGALQGQPIVVSAAPSRATPQPRVLLVGDDLKVWTIYSTLALARAKVGELSSLGHVILPVSRSICRRTWIRSCARCISGQCSAKISSGRTASSPSARTAPL
jgi:hypothetical protein